MTYVLQLAEHADLPVQTVLRVLLRQPTNEAAQRKVTEAVALFARGPGVGAEMLRLEDRRGSSG
jgi:hypothetical protein